MTSDKALQTRTSYTWKQSLHAVYLHGNNFLHKSPSILQARRLKVSEQIPSVSRGYDYKWAVCTLLTTGKIVWIDCSDIYSFWTDGWSNEWPICLAAFGMHRTTPSQPSLGIYDALFRFKRWPRFSLSW